jgi:hypothetical protein
MLRNGYFMTVVISVFYTKIWNVVENVNDSSLAKPFDSNISPKTLPNSTDSA